LEVQHGELLDVKRYLDDKKEHQLDHWSPFYESCLRSVEKFRPITPETKIIEIGTGSGYFPIYCALRGLNCKGLEISQPLIERAHDNAKRHGVEIEIQLGNLETTDIGQNVYDVAMASSVFEHVEHWRVGLKRVYDCLKPGGAMFFESTNKFSLISGEYRGVPLYGWLPDKARYELRKIVHGRDIMQLGIDFHQFRYPLLRREFKKLGFREIYDRVDLADPKQLTAEWKRKIMHLAKTNPLLRAMSLTFAETTRFVCIK
jgi:2-polyprenyl-3-methyl-5-hydroxy-6-metoxy-1,4-benzoquinol methylase